MGSSECHWGRLHGRHSDLSGSGTSLLFGRARTNDVHPTFVGRGDVVCALAVDAGDLFVGTNDASNVADLAEVPVAGVAGGGADDTPLWASA